MAFILAIDQGTTGSCALIINEHGQIKGEGSFEHPQHFPEPGFVEHKAEEIKTSVKKSSNKSFGKRPHQSHRSQGHRHHQSTRNGVSL